MLDFSALEMKAATFHFNSKISTRVVRQVEGDINENGDTLWSGLSYEEELILLTGSPYFFNILSLARLQAGETLLRQTC